MTLLEQLTALEQAATPRPWMHVDRAMEVVYVRPDETYAGVASELVTPDAALVVATRNALPVLLAAIRAAVDTSASLIVERSTPTLDYWKCLECRRSSVNWESEIPHRHECRAAALRIALAPLLAEVE